MPLWILFFTALTLALHSVPAEAPEPEPSAPVEVVLTEPVFRAESPYQEQVLWEVKVRPGSINGLPCQSYSLNYERGNTVYLETLDGGLVIRNDGMYWNQVILDQEAVLLRPGQEPEPTPHCPDLLGALPFSSESMD